MYREALIQVVARLIIETQTGKVQWKRRCFTDAERRHFRDIPYGGMVYSTEWEKCRLQLYRFKCPGPYPGENTGTAAMQADPDFLFKIAIDIVDEKGEIEYILEPVYAMTSLFKTVQALCSPSLKKIEALLQ
ncbi:MAG: hypothetical protein LBN39_00615 [Planctomycetaceae bacterium]|nr:hypothetical protein [Planctomycetaceae bacterium]